MKSLPWIFGVAVTSLGFVGEARAQSPPRDFQDGMRRVERLLDPDRWRDFVSGLVDDDRGRDWDQDRDRDWDRDRGRDWDRGRTDRDRDDDQWFDPRWWHDGRRDRDRDRWDDGRRSPRFGPPRHVPDRDYGRRPGWRERTTLGARLRDTQDGVQIAYVAPRSAARRAGLRPGDQLLAVDGRRVDDQRDVRRILRRSDPGDRVRILFERHGQVRRTVAVLEAQRRTF